MDESFRRVINLIGRYQGTRTDKAVLMVSAAKQISSEGSVSINQICDWFEAAQLARPNSTVLLRSLIDDRRVSVRKRLIRALEKADQFLEATYPELQPSRPEKTGKLSSELKMSLSRTPGIDDAYVSDLEKMLELFATLHVLENSMRRLIEKILSEKFGHEWWSVSASNPQKKKHNDRIEKEISRKWLPARSSLGPLYSLDWSDLISIMRKYESDFIPIIGEIDFLHRFTDLGLIRHVIAHHGFVDDEKDFERVKLAHYDWVKQVSRVPKG